MEALLLYIIKSGVCISLLYLCFISLFRNTTWFRFNRLIILCGCIVCTLLPFVQVELQEKTFVSIPVEAIQQITSTQSDMEMLVEEIPQTSHAPQTSLFLVIAGICYTFGCLVVLIVTLLSHFRIRAIIRCSECFEYDSFKLYVSQEQKESFSWGRCIVVPKDLYVSKEHFNEILLHEMSHIRHRHSDDILLLQLFVIFHWFNPFVWMLRNELLDIHEYQVDNDVIHQGINATQYQLLLVKKAVGGRLYILTNGFCRSKLKKRITMMLKKRTNRMVQLRALLFVPLVAGVICSFATTTIVMVPVIMEQDSAWTYPLPGSTFTHSYGERQGRKHAGIDLKADAGTEIKSAFAGVVTSSTFDRNYGKLVVIRHNNGLETVYAHNSKNLVKEGDKVKAGQVIALVGNTGRCVAPHCHFEIRKNGHSIDPETIFDTTTQTLRTE